MPDMSLDEDSSVISLTDDVLKLLLIESSDSDAHMVQVYLRTGLDANFTIERRSSVTDAVDVLCEEQFDLVLLDLMLPDSTGMETFHAVVANAPDSAILILSGNDDHELALEAVRMGAQDLIHKADLNASTLGREVSLVLERFNVVRTERALRAAEDQIRLARQLQRGLYPQSAPDLAGFDIAGHAWAAEHACGDYFDFVPMKDGALGIAVGDVSGHGLSAALKMVEARATLHALSGYEHNLDQLLCGIHRVFSSGPQYNTRCLFLTLFLARLDETTRRLTYAAAGHPAFHLTAAGDVHRLDPTDFPIGIAEEMTCEGAREVLLNPGDILVIPTDGLYEVGANDGNAFGVVRMLDVVREYRHESANDIITAMYQAARDHMPALKQEDDMSAVVIKSLG